jgi:hypothetical protein
MWPILFVLLGPCTDFLTAQDANPDNFSEQIQKLTDAIATTRAQLEQSQRQILDLQKQLQTLQLHVAQSQTAAAISESPVASSASTSQREPADNDSALEDIHDRQVMQESQVATLEQTKVESESKYPVKITGLILFNGFVNTQEVDMAATPTLAVGGSGSTGFSMRQTVLGIDARGPHLFGASSFADLHVDFDGTPQSSNYTTSYPGPYSANATLLRLRTAHAGLKWQHTEAYFSLDHPIFSPNSPTSLTAIAEPALAWSGNLWTWTPQLGLNQDVPLSPSDSIQLQAALVDVGDAPLSPATSSSGTSTGSPPSSAEHGRWPGVETRVALLGSRSNEQNGNHFGLGGYFAPHRTLLGPSFDSWAASLDARLLMPGRLELTGGSYRGLGLGGLGGGAFKDFVYRTDPETGAYYVHPLDDVGGWAQLKEKINERVQLNAAFGIDDAFASEVRRFAIPSGTLYQNLSKNRTFTGNVIFSPSAYLLFSLEYRHLNSSPVLGLPARSNIIGLGAGFKF